MEFIEEMQSPFIRRYPSGFCSSNDSMSDFVVVIDSNIVNKEKNYRRRISFASDQTRTSRSGSPDSVGSVKRALFVEPQASNKSTLCVDLGDHFDTPNKHGITPLMIACRDNNFEYVKQFVSRGANINSVDDRGYTPLFYSVRGGHNLITEYLIQNGADCHTTINGGFSLLMYAAMNGDCEHIQLLHHHISINTVDEDGMSPLMYATCNKHADAMDFLLFLKANPYCISKEGKTALFMCIEEGYEEGLDVLNKYNVSLNILGSGAKHGALYYACILNHRNIARVLLKEKTNLSHFLDDLCKTPSRVAQSIIEVGLQELYLTMNTERQKYIRLSFLEGCRKYGEALLSFVNSSSHISIPCSQIADVFIYCIKISKMLCSQFQTLHVCDFIWKNIGHALNYLDTLRTRCPDPNKAIGPSFFTRVIFTLLEGFCLCYSSYEGSNDNEQINIIKCQQMVFTDQTLIHFLVKNKSLLLLMNKNDPMVYHQLTYYPMAMTAIDSEDTRNSCCS